MQVKMLKNTPGSPDGLKVEIYKKDEKYDLPEKLGKVFLSIKVAEMVTVPSNKDAGSSFENKSKDDKKEEEKEEKKKSRKDKE